MDEDEMQDVGMQAVEMQEDEMQVWFITGAARGLGREIARCALQRGHAVVAAVRDPASVPDDLARDLGDAVVAERLLALQVDVTDADGVGSAVQRAVEHFGRVDVLVNNAGQGILGAVEEVGDREARDIFDVNVFGVLTVTRAVLPVMRRQRKGHVVMVSSMGGVTQPGAGWGIYGASKFAMEGFSEALRHEVSPLGIDVTLVEPGGFRTDFLDARSLRQAARVLSDYDDTSGRTRRASTERNHQQQGDPALAAAAIVDIAERPDPPLRLPLGEDAIAAIEQKIASLTADVDAARGIRTSH